MFMHQILKRKISSKAVVVRFGHHRTLVGDLPFPKSHKVKIRSDGVSFNQSLLVN